LDLIHSVWNLFEVPPRSSVVIHVLFTVLQNKFIKYLVAPVLRHFVHSAANDIP